MFEFLHSKKQKGFTLIELLVVISIIGTLSGMVMVTFKGTTQKAKIARGQSFSASVQNILGAECLGAWNFNEGSGTTAINSMGINHGTILGGAAYSPDTPNGSAASGGYSLNFDGSDDYVAVSANLTGGLRQITIEAWVNADRASSMVFTTGNAVILHFRGAGFYLTAEDGTISNYLGWSPAPEIGRWTHLVATWNGDKMSLYQDGMQQTATRSWSGGATGRLISSTIFYIGRYFNASQPAFQGRIDSVKLYGQAITAGRVRTNYLAGLKNLFARRIITQEEYRERVSAANQKYVLREQEK
jgi:prepilin-type N-terminal cleavage/methylation domain-containing protein